MLTPGRMLTRDFETLISSQRGDTSAENRNCDAAQKRITLGTRPQGADVWAHPLTHQALTAVQPEWEYAVTGLETRATTTRSPPSRTAAPPSRRTRGSPLAILCPNHHVLFDLGAFTIAADYSL